MRQLHDLMHFRSHISEITFLNCIFYVQSVPIVLLTDNIYAYTWIGNDSVNYMLRRNNPCNIIYGRCCEGLVVHNE